VYLIAQKLIHTEEVQVIKAKDVRQDFKIGDYGVIDGIFPQRQNMQGLIALLLDAEVMDPEMEFCLEL
jgi:hypothetical protein